MKRDNLLSGSMFSVAMLELSKHVHQSISHFINRSMYALYKHLSRVCVDECLDILVYVCDKAHVYLICSRYSYAFACHFDRV